MIALDIRCPCGKAAGLETLPFTREQHRWRVACPDCYDPTPRSDDEGPAATATCEGFGETPELAIADWWAQAERVWDIDYLPNTLFAELSEQAGDEADRQSGWVKVFSRALEHASMPLASRPVWYLPYGGRVQ